LLAFGVALLAYNVLAVLRAAINATHDLKAAQIEISPYYLSVEIKANYAGMMIAVAAAVWVAYDAMNALQIARILLRIASCVDPMAFRNHPRGPKKTLKKGRVSGTVARSHVSTARVLKEAGGY
jgi:hypothetical protein